jgi:tetratricopeptide (TPR) repeat protein
MNVVTKTLLIALMLSVPAAPAMACKNHLPRKADVQANQPIHDANNKAVRLIDQGRATEAVKLLEDAVQRWPKQYSLASNLGTAYELTGNNEQALRWVKRGMELRPSSHFGTEWLHVEILKAKQEIAKDADWLKTHSVIDLEKTPRSKARLALRYQLKERSKLVPAPDAIVADLYYLLGKIESTGAPNEARLALAQSLKYGDLRQVEVAALTEKLPPKK